MKKAWKKYFKRSFVFSCTKGKDHIRELAFNAGYKAGELAEWERLINIVDEYEQKEIING